MRMVETMLSSCCSWRAAPLSGNCRTSRTIGGSAVFENALKIGIVVRRGRLGRARSERTEGARARSSSVVALDGVEMGPIGSEGLQGCVADGLRDRRPGSLPRWNCGLKSSTRSIFSRAESERPRACSSAASRRRTCRRRYPTVRPTATAATHQMTADPMALAAPTAVLKSARSRKDARTPARAALRPTSTPLRPAATDGDKDHSCSDRFEGMDGRVDPVDDQDHDHFEHDRDRQHYPAIALESGCWVPGEHVAQRSRGPRSS